MKIVHKSVTNKLVYFSTLLLFLVATLVCSGINSLKAQTHTIHNDVFWNTKDGQPIYSQGGGIFKFVDPISGVQKYYWYGVHYKEADIYRNNPTASVKGAKFQYRLG